MSSKGVAAREWHAIESGFGIRQSGVCGTAAFPLRGLWQTMTSSPSFLPISGDNGTHLTDPMTI